MSNLPRLLEQRSGSGELQATLSQGKKMILFFLLLASIVLMVANNKKNSLQI